MDSHKHPRIYQFSKFCRDMGILAINRKIFLDFEKETFCGTYCVKLTPKMFIVIASLETKQNKKDEASRWQKRTKTPSQPFGHLNIRSTSAFTPPA